MHPEKSRDSSGTHTHVSNSPTRLFCSAHQARSHRARVSTDYSGTGLIPVEFEDEHVAQRANGAGFRPEELHRLECTCTACAP